jgi:hypothetical protein
VYLSGDPFHPDAVGNRNLERKAFSAKSLDLRFYLFGQIVAGMIVKGDVRAFASKHLAECRSNASRAA